MPKRKIALIDARTNNQLATWRRTIKQVRGFLFDVHEHGINIAVADADGDSIWVPRRVFDELLRWYTGNETLGKR